MQSLETYYGIRAELSEYLNPENMRLMHKVAAEYAALEQLSDKEYFVFFHRMKISATDVHFETPGGLTNRVAEIALAFTVNKKQIQSGDIKFVNHIVAPKDISLGAISYFPSPEEIVYFIPSNFFNDKIIFQNMIVTFIRRTLRQNHRKIKVTVSVRPTTQYKSKLTTENRIKSTRLDARFEREVQMNLPFEDDAEPQLIDRVDARDEGSLDTELKILEYLFRKEDRDPLHIVIIQDAIAFASDNELDNLARCLASILPEVREKAALLSLQEILLFLDSRRMQRFTNLAERFKVALSFSNDKRQYVEAVAKMLSSKLSEHDVFYDMLYQDQLARPDLDTYLQKIYHDQSDLVVIFISEGYENKQWCGLEWRAIRDLIKKKKPESIMPVRFDKTEISGLFSIDGYIDVSALEPSKLVDLILKRIASLSQPQGASGLRGGGYNSTARGQARKISNRYSRKSRIRRK